MYQATSPRLSQSKIGTMAGCASCAASRRLATKSADDALVARDARMEQLERHLAAERQVAHAPHGAERAGAQRGEDLVVVGERPAESCFGRLVGARRLELFARERDHRSSADEPIDRAEQGRDGRKSLLGVRTQRAIDDAGERARTVGTHELNRRHFIRRRVLTGERGEARRRELPLIARRSRTPYAVGPLVRHRHESEVGRDAGGDLGHRHRPLPSHHPQTPHRRREDGLGGHASVRGPEVVEVAQPRTDLAQHAQRAGNVVRAHARQSGGDRFAGDPASQVARTALIHRERRPIVVRRGNRRVVSVRQVSRFRLEPYGVRVVRARSPATATARARRRPLDSGDAACGVLRIPTPSPAAAATRADAPAAPASWCTWTGAGPLRGRLPPTHPPLRSLGSTERPSHLRLGKDLLGRRGELGDERDVGQDGDLDLSDGERRPVALHR